MYEKVLDKIIKIQKWYRGCISRKLILIPNSYYQTKIWRKNQKWYISGKSNECEKYQINLIEQIVKTQLNKTDDRINIETFKLTNNRYPMKKDDGYEWTENFDGKIIFNHNLYYFNLKFICDSGGAQTRSLREVYHFVRIQLEYLLSNKNYKNKIFFINILDGDTSYKNMNKFIFLLNKPKYNSINEYVFIGSLFQFQSFYRKQ